MTLELQKPRPIWQIMFSTHHTDVGSTLPNEFSYILHSYGWFTSTWN